MNLGWDKLWSHDLHDSVGRHLYVEDVTGVLSKEKTEIRQAISVRGVLVEPWLGCTIFEHIGYNESVVYNL